MGPPPDPPARLDALGVRACVPGSRQRRTDGNAPRPQRLGAVPRGGAVSMKVTGAQDVARSIREAFHIARTGRPGPVLVDIPKDVLITETEWVWPKQVDLPGYKPTTKGNQRQVREAVNLIMQAERPVLYVGGGVLKSDATKELFELATEGKLPVVTTLMARGAFPDSHELCFGMPGMHGNYTAVTAM